MDQQQKHQENKESIMWICQKRTPEHDLTQEPGNHP